jgi:hypothetical protein
MVTNRISLLLDDHQSAWAERGMRSCSAMLTSPLSPRMLVGRLRPTEPQCLRKLRGRPAANACLTRRANAVSRCWVPPSAARASRPATRHTRPHAAHPAWRHNDTCGAASADTRGEGLGGLVEAGRHRPATMTSESTPGSSCARAMSAMLDSGRGGRRGARGTIRGAVLATTL